MPLFDADRIDALFAVLGRTGGQQVLERFADELAAEIRALADLAAQGDLCATARHAHGLKGAAANFGACDLQAISRRVEQVATTPDASARLAGLLADLELVARQTALAARHL